MPYNTNIPQPTDKLSQSQADLLANFQAINTLVSINHGTFGAPDEGKHKFVQLPQQTPPFPPSFNPAAAQIALIAQNDTATGRTELYFQRPAGTAAPLDFYSWTSSSTSASPKGWAILPAGIIIKWGTATVAVNQNSEATELFAAGAGIPVFANVAGNPTVTVSLSGGAGMDKALFVQAVSNTSVTVYNANGSGGPRNFYYFAIGY